MKNFTLIAATVLTILAGASQAHAIDFSVTLTQIDGTALRENNEPVTLASVAENALLASFQDEPNITGEEKVRRFVIARKIHETRKDPALTADDIALVKKLIGKAYNPLVTGQAYMLLDPASVPK